MGTNNLSTKNPGDVIASADPNQYKTALDGDVVPRNSSGVPENVSSSLGSTLYSWLSAYIKKIYVGIPADDFTIEGTSSTIFFKLASVIKAKIDTNGIDGTYIKASSTPESSLNFSRKLRKLELSAAAGTISIPSDVTWVRILAWGSGGGGAGGGGGGGGGGGSSGAFADVWRPVTAGGTLTYTTGGGGTGGTASDFGANGTATTITTGGFALSIPGGQAGSPYGSGGAGGEVSAGYYYRRAAIGGDGSPAGLPGEANEYNAAAAEGAAGAGGGGGGAGYGAGGIGVGGGDTGGTGGLGAGGGGGGQTNGLGGVGGRGVVVLLAVTTDTGWT